MKVMKIMAKQKQSEVVQSCLTLRHPISFQRSHAYTAALNAPACSKPRPTPLPQTPGHSQASLGQSLVGSLLLSPGSWCAHALFVPSKHLFAQSCVSSGSSMMGLLVTSSKRPYAIPRSAAPRAAALREVHC